MHSKSNKLKSKCTDFFTRKNALEEDGFKEWVFTSAMLFNAPLTHFTGVDIKNGGIWQTRLEENKRLRKACPA